MAKSISYIDRIMLVYDRLEEYTSVLEQKRDSRATFTYAYSIMTLTIAEGFIAAKFNNKEWVTCLAEEFARQYISALESYDHDQSAPGGWQIAFDTFRNSRSSVIEELIISMYVHIVQDLPKALIIVGLEDQKGKSCIADYHKMNTLLNLSIDNIQVKVAKRYNPILRWMDGIVGTKDEIFTNYGIRLARGMSWYNTRRMMEPGMAEITLKSFNKSVTTFVDAITHSKYWIARVAINIIRFLIQRFRKWGSS